MVARAPRESRTRRTRAGRPREVRAVDPGSWDRVAIIVALREWTAVIGRAPRAHEWSSTGAGVGTGSARWLAEHPRWPSAGTVVYHFGSWSDGLRAAGLPRLAFEHELPRRERVASAVALRAAGESFRSIAEQLGVHLRTVYRYLDASTCAGCGGPALYGEYCRECAPRAGPAATHEEIVAALKAWNAAHGAPPREQDWSLASQTWRDAWPRWPGASTVMRVFGSWNTALEVAGLPTHRYAWAREEALERLVAWARAHGRPPTVADARADRQLPGLQTCRQLYDPGTAARQRTPVPSASSIRRRFRGSWNAARVAAGLPASRGGRRPTANGAVTPCDRAS